MPVVVQLVRKFITF